MTELKDFFVASVGAAAALIGLLFVAITLGPEEFFGAGADAQKHGQATGAFIALGNVFFVSLAALIPRTAQIVIVVALTAVYQIVRESTAMGRTFPKRRGWRNFGLVSLCIYVLELVIAVRLAWKIGNPQGLVYTVLGLYAYALSTSWGLLGARNATKGGSGS